MAWLLPGRGHLPSLSNPAAVSLKYVFRKVECLEMAMVVYSHNPSKLRQRDQKFRANLGSLTRCSLINKGHAYSCGLLVSDLHCGSPPNEAVLFP